MECLQAVRIAAAHDCIVSYRSQLHSGHASTKAADSEHQCSPGGQQEVRIAAHEQVLETQCSRSARLSNEGLVISKPRM